MEVQEYLERERLRKNFPQFIEQVFATTNPGTEYLPNWHIDLVGEYLQAAQRGEIKRLLINIPPRYLKSQSVSVAWPAWLLGHDPSRRIIASSYASGLAIKHSTDCRLVVESEWFNSCFPDFELAPDQNEKAKFQTTQRGHRIATSTGGTLTGEGGNFLIVDDAHKPGEVLSDVMRQRVLDWFDQSFISRLDDKKHGVIVVIMQRLHEKDLCGHLLAKGGWEWLKIPAIAEEDEEINRYGVHVVRHRGDVLHSERENADDLERLKIEMGSYVFAAQYQQNPVPAEGGMVQYAWFRRYATPPDEGRVIQSWDTAIKATQDNDYSVCTTWRELDGKHYLLDVHRQRLEYPDLKRHVMAHAAKYSAIAVLIEDKASGQSLIQDLQRETALPIIPVMPVKDKITRAAAITPLIESGKLYLPEQAGWLAEYESELCTFPLAAHDDQMDSTSQYLNWLQAKTIKTPRIRRL